MARTISLSQFKNKQKQAINKYNQKVRRYNNQVKTAVNKYNSEVRRHNARVRADRQRVISQLNKLKRTSTNSSIYSPIRESSVSLNKSYERLETNEPQISKIAYGNNLELV